MSLKEIPDSDAVSKPNDSSAPSPVRDGRGGNPEKSTSASGDAISTQSVQTALDFMNELKPRIMEELGGRDLRVGLKFMDIMRPDRGDLTQAHVMWAGPSYNDEHAKRLKTVSGTFPSSRACDIEG